MHFTIGRDQDIDIGAQSFWSLEDEHEAGTALEKEIETRLS
ncbi:MAG: hypothetical protein PUJ43_03220 [Bacillales bacterium]|nr:hypothetical protein [Bacillales bacterium]